MNIKIRKLSKNIKLPTRATAGSSCYDIYSPVFKLVGPFEFASFPTGLTFELQEGYELEVRPRSSLAGKGLIILNSPGTLDSDYRGELIIITKNLSSDTIKIDIGDRIAQIKLNRVEPIEFEIVGKLSNTSRGGGGFGSTGR